MALTVDNILDEKVVLENSEELTIRQYFSRLMLELWTNEEGFSGKRPFGDSGWINGDVCWHLEEKYGIEADDVRELVTLALRHESETK